MINAFINTIGVLFLSIHFLYFLTLNCITNEQFAVLPKYLYAKHKNLSVTSNWAKELYKSHLYALGVTSNFNGITKNMLRFDQVLNFIKNCSNPEDFQWFLSNNTDLDPSDISAACIYYNKTSLLSMISHVAQPKVTLSNFIKNKKHPLPTSYIDAMALQYCELNKNTFIVFLYPSISNYPYKKIYSILQTKCKIIYTKDIKLSQKGALNITNIAYENARNHSANNALSPNNPNYLKYVQKKVAHRFLHKDLSGFYNLKVVLLECNDSSTLRTCKKSIRKFLNTENATGEKSRAPIHTSDTHEETLKLAQTCFNANSVDFINFADFKALPRFHSHLMLLKKFLAKNKFNDECFCVEGSAVMSAYGIRDCNDIDVIHHDYDFLVDSLESGQLIHSHNPIIPLHTCKKDDLIFDPQNYFYYKNVKFITLQELYAMKCKRNLKKDRIDLVLINACLMNK